MEKLHHSFLVPLDSCSDGREQPFEPTVLSAKATRNLNDVGSVLRVMNEFRNSYPVLFSTMPGKSVSTVANPLVPGSAVNIAPLARRFSLAVHPSLQSGAALSLATFLDKMLSAKLDTLTTPAVTHSPVPSGANALFLVPGGKLHTVDTVAGTGSEMRICCASAPAAEAPMAASLHGIAVHHRREGEYISSCASLHVASPTYNVSVTQPDE